jgi:hypothetical protein
MAGSNCKVNICSRTIYPSSPNDLIGDPVTLQPLDSRLKRSGKTKGAEYEKKQDINPVKGEKDKVTAA